MACLRTFGRWRALRCVVAAGLLAIAGAAWSGIDAPVRVVFDGGRKEMTLSLRNPGQSPSLVQVWIDEGDPRVEPSQVNSPFLITQPLVRLEPTSLRNLRILSMPEAASLPADRESRFFLNLLDIPPRVDPSQERDMLTLAVRYRMPFIYRPAALQGEANPHLAIAASMPWTLLHENGQWRLRASNPGRYWLSVGHIVLTQDGMAYRAGNGEIAPGGSQDFVLGATSPADAADRPAPDRSRPMQLTYTVVDDYGHLHPVEARLQPPAG